MSNERRNISDRGGPGEQPLDRFRAWQEDRERRERGEIIDRRLDDIRRLSRADLDSLAETYGAERIAGEIAARAAVQLQGVKIIVDPGGQRVRFPDDMDLEARDAEAVRIARANKARHVHVQLREEAIARLGDMIVEACGGDEDRANLIACQLGERRISALLRVHKRERRAALARALEELTDE